MPLGAMTKAENDEVFFVITDKIRKLYEVCYPTNNDSRLTAEIAEANKNPDVEFGITKSEKRIAKLVCDEIARDRTFAGYRHVVSARAKDPEYIDSSSTDWSMGN